MREALIKIQIRMIKPVDHRTLYATVHVRQVADAIQDAIEPQGVGVVMEARHLCMMMRGVEKQHSSTVTSAMLGVFQKQNTRAEFLSLVQARPQGGL